MNVYAPYKYNPAEMPPEFLRQSFIGREDTLDHLLAAVREQTETETIQHYLVLGPRGIGKTSLLLMLQLRLKETPNLAERWLCVQYREEEFYVHTLRDLLALALEHLDAENHIPEAAKILATAEGQEDDKESLATITSGLRKISKLYKKRILLLVDNFDLVFPKGAGGKADQRAFRKLLSTQPFIMVIGTSVEAFEDIASYDQAFFDFFSPVYLEYLTEDQIEQLLHTYAKLDNNEDFIKNYGESRDKVRAITYLTGGNPRLVLMLYDILSRQQFLPVVEALRETLDQLTPLLKDVLENMPSQQTKVLDALVRLNGVASPSEIAKRARLSLNTVTVQLGRLKDARFVEVTGGGKGKPSTYRVREQMFRTWYQMRYLRPARRRIELFVEFLRSWFSIEDRLTSLGKMRKEFDKHMADGRGLQAREAALGMEYVAASFEDAAVRTAQLQDVAQAYGRIGELREAAMLLGEMCCAEARPQEDYEVKGYFALGELFRGKQDYAGAVSTYQEILKRDRDNVEAVIGLAASLIHSGELRRACEELLRIASRSNLPIEARCKTFWLLGMAEAAMNKQDEALQHFEEVANCRDGPVTFTASALEHIGDIHQKQGSFRQAISSYTAVAEVKGVEPTIIARTLQKRGTLKGQIGDATGAMADFSAIIDTENAPKDAIVCAYLGRAMARLQIGDFEQGRQDLAVIMNTEEAPQPEGMLALLFMSTAELVCGDLEGGIQIVTRAIAAARSSKHSFCANAGLLIRAYMRALAGDYAEAIADLEASERKNLASVSVFSNGALRLLSSRLYREGKEVEAKSLLRRLPEFEPPGLSTERRVRIRTEIATDLASQVSLTAGLDALDALLETASSEVRARLEFMRPALEYARTGSEDVLAKLPQEERDIAKRIAGKILDARERAS